MTIYIYSGAGSSQTSTSILQRAFSQALHNFKIPVRMIGHDALNDPDAPWLKDGEVLVVGGGEFTPMKAKLTPIGYKNIRDFAARKTYLGICKGGYAGAAQIEFLSKDEKKTSPGFGFFNGVAKGAIPITPSMYTGNNDSACIAVFHHEKYDRDFPALYWGGPSFVLEPSAHAEVEPLITLQVPYQQEKITVGVKVKVGDNGGKAVLLGYHSEATPHFLRDWVLKFSSSEADNLRLESEIDRYKRGQFFLGFAALLDDLEIIQDHSFLDQILHPLDYDPKTSRRKIPLVDFQMA